MPFPTLTVLRRQPQKSYQRRLLQEIPNLKKLNISFRWIGYESLETIELILDTLNAASKIDDMNYLGSDLHLLLPKKEKIWAVKVSGIWRVTFKFEGGDAYIVDYLDYH